MWRKLNGFWWKSFCLPVELPKVLLENGNTNQIKLGPIWKYYYEEILLWLRLYKNCNVLKNASVGILFIFLCKFYIYFNNKFALTNKKINKYIHRHVV